MNISTIPAAPYFLEGYMSAPDTFCHEDMV